MAALTGVAARSCAASSSTRATRRSQLPYEQAQTRQVAAPRPATTTCRPTSRGSACAPRSSTARTSSSSAASATRSASSSAGRDRRLAARAARRARSRPRARADHADPPHGRAEGRRELPPLVEAVQRAGRTVLWMCDPMHGNTETTPNGIKTRRFDNILAELEQSFEVHEELGSRLGGVHVELTGEDVTECIGGARGLDRGRPRARVRAASTRASTTSRRSRWRCASRAGWDGRRGEPPTRHIGAVNAWRSSDRSGLRGEPAGRSQEKPPSPEPPR